MTAPDPVFEVTKDLADPGHPHRTYAPSLKSEARTPNYRSIYFDEIFIKKKAIVRQTSDRAAI